VVEEPAKALNERGVEMAKVLRCKDVGFDCGYEIRADTEEELMEKVAAHAAQVHDMKEVTEDVAAKVKAAIKDE
jgi:predicted small metal-binding protein